MSLLSTLTGTPAIKNKPNTKVPGKPKPEKQGVNDPGQMVSQLAFNSEISIIKSKIDTFNNLIVAVIFVLAVCFIGLFFNYYQFSSASYNEYSQRVKELSDEKYLNLNNRLFALEETIKTLLKQGSSAASIQE
ncbi:hypothetical protein A2368_03120 [Candidatus Collierbacteria bacterium RIFOXYB1_FULL_49_13]|uniref:Uncharacterized protein n=1 Tax=Candidatus Collierbacteria bacterium RIFOXYB1_FULL_49_13 TaxID=1817728 RepID=A0A1F5FJQ2_9BACT|nr:MAG: hypothetical protein A2368_03120 [Candidatus Collierbacteria bacterium RIFOXYB1_FULL_49_13]